MKKILTTSAYFNKISQQEQPKKRFFGDIQVEIFVPEIDSTTNPITFQKMQQMAEEALKRAAWELRFKQIDLSLDHDLSDPQTQADIGEEPVEVDVQMSGYNITGSS